MKFPTASARDAGRSVPSERPPRERRPLLPALIVVLLVTWFIAVAGYRYDDVRLSGDLAEYVNNPIRLLYGQVPYRDFWLVHPPGEVWLPALVYRLGGGVNAVLIMGVAISVLVGLAAFAVAQRISGSTTAGVCGAALVFFAGAPAYYEGYAYLHAWLLCLLLSAWRFHGYLESHERSRLFWAAALIGAGMCFRFYLTGAAAAALGIVTLLEARSRDQSWRELLKASLTCAVGFSVAPLLASLALLDVAAAMWSNVALESVSHATTLHPPYGHHLLPLWSEWLYRFDLLRNHPHWWRHHVDAFEASSALLQDLAAHLTPFLAVGCWFALRKTSRTPHGPAGWSTLFILLWGGFTFLRSLTRGGPPGQLAQSVTPLLFVLVLLRPRVMAWWRDAPGPASLAWAVCLMGVLIGLGQRAPAFTLLKLNALRTRTFPVLAPKGTILFGDELQAAEAQQLIQIVLDETAESDPIFVVPWEAPALYALTGRRNATSSDSLIDLVYRPNAVQQQRLCDELAATPPRLVVHRPGADFTGDATLGPVERACPLIAAHLNENFEPFRRIGRFTIYRPRRNASAAPGAGNEALSSRVDPDAAEIR